MSTFLRSRVAPLLPLLLALAVSGSAAACSSSTTSARRTEQAPTEPAPTDLEPSATPAIRDAIDPKIVSALKAAGVDVSKPADLDFETIIKNDTKREAVMESFTIALGVTCTGCHARAGTRIDYEAPTAKKNVAKKMWSQLVRGLQKKDGSAIYCDSCHQGSMKFLDRADDRALTTWMTENFVGKLGRVDGAEHSCATCHGDPFNGSILAGWSK